MNKYSLSFLGFFLNSSSRTKKSLESKDLWVNSMFAIYGFSFNSNEDELSPYNGDYLIQFNKPYERKIKEVRLELSHIPLKKIKGDIDEETQLFSDLLDQNLKKQKVIIHGNENTFYLPKNYWYENTKVIKGKSKVTDKNGNFSIKEKNIEIQETHLCIKCQPTTYKKDNISIIREPASIELLGKSKKEKKPALVKENLDFFKQEVQDYKILTVEEVLLFLQQISILSNS